MPPKRAPGRKTATAAARKPAARKPAAPKTPRSTRRTARRRNKPPNQAAMASVSYEEGGRE